MKIIAKIDNERVLVELTRTEISRIHGQAYDYTKFSDHWMAVGAEMDLNALCSTLEALRQLDSAKIENARKQLEQAMAMVSQCKTNLEALMLFDKLKEDL